MTKLKRTEGAGAVALLTVNFDAEAFDLKEARPERLFGRYSYGRYAVRAGFPRLFELLGKHGVPATFFVPGADARRHPELIRELVGGGHEIAARGIDLEDFAALGGQLSPRTLGHLAELGFSYDASFQDADYPYVVGLGGEKLVELPSSFALDDAPIYSARHTHARLRAIWQDEIRAMHAEGTLIPLTLNLRGDFGSTRAARIAVLDGLLAELKELGGVRFMTCRELAEYTLSLNLPLEPDPYLAHAETLSKTVYRGDLAIKPL